MNQEIYALVGYLCASDGFVGIFWHYGIGFGVIGLILGFLAGRRLRGSRRSR